MLTTIPQTSLQLHRTPQHDGIISPFLLDPTTITSRKRHSTHLQKAIWLHMPVIIRDLHTRQLALHQLNYLSSLRHPNLEQFLGVVIDKTQNSLVTEFIRGSVLANLLARPQRLNTRVALTIAIDIARALLYLHATTGRPHGSLGATSVVYDHARKRAVVLLPTRIETSTPYAAPECREGLSVDTAADVYSLAVLVVLLFRNGSMPLATRQVYNLPKPLQPVVQKALCRDRHARPGVEQLCQVLMSVQRDFSF